MYHDQLLTRIWVWAGERTLLTRLIWALTKRRQTSPRPHFKTCLRPWVASTLRSQEKKEITEFESLPTQLKQRGSQTQDYTEKVVGSLPRREKTLKDDNHSPLPSIWNRSKVVQGYQQMAAHLQVHGSLNIKCLGLNLLSLFLLLSGVSYWIESNLDIVSSMGFCSQKVIDEKQGFGMNDSNTAFLRAIQMIRLLLGKTTAIRVISLSPVGKGGHKH